mmetsp:Transcript_24754/g.38543  ORF Transcript_24754/g.38543 Transcript_24754/m.38543 type:complete len:250 (-) Transcript_24754:443-1192(-)
MLLQAVDRLADNSFLVVEETQLQKGISLRRLVALLVGDIEQVLEMLDGCVDVAVLAVSLSELLVGLTSLGFIIGFFTEGQEFIQELNGFLQVTELLVNMTNFLIAFGLLLAVFSPLRGVQALLEELQGLVVVVHVLEADGDDLIHSDQFLRNVLLNFLNVAMDDLLQGRFQIILGVEDVQYLLFADAEAFVGFCFAYYILGINTGIEALLVEIRSRFIVVKSFKLLGYSSVFFEALLDVVLPEEALGVL